MTVWSRLDPTPGEHRHPAPLGSQPEPPRGCRPPGPSGMTGFVGDPIPLAESIDTLLRRARNPSRPGWLTFPTKRGDRAARESIPAGADARSPRRWLREQLEQLAV